MNGVTRRPQTLAAKGCTRLLVATACLIFGAAAHATPEAAQTPAAATPYATIARAAAGDPQGVDDAGVSADH